MLAWAMAGSGAPPAKRRPSADHAVLSWVTEGSARSGLKSAGSVTSGAQASSLTQPALRR
jgi:hypothetical protein